MTDLAELKDELVARFDKTIDDAADSYRDYIERSKKQILKELDDRMELLKTLSTWNLIECHHIGKYSIPSEWGNLATISVDNKQFAQFPTTKGKQYDVWVIVKERKPEGQA